MEKDEPVASEEQLVYARGLDVGVILALAALALCFAAYLSGLLPSAVPPERLPELWRLPVAEYVARSGVPHGWGWIAMLGHGDMLSLASVAFLVSISTLCLLLLLPVYVARRDWKYLAMTLAEIGVIVAAASGVFVTVH